MWVSVIFSILLLSTATNGAKILGVFMSPSHSHQIFFQPIWRELSLRGHQVTVYTPSPLNDPTLTNLTEYDLSFSYKHKTAIEEGADYETLMNWYATIAEEQLSHSYLKNLINNTDNQNYDLLLVEYLWQPYFGLKEVYNVPMVGLLSTPMTILGSDALGMEKHQIMDPDMFLQFSYAESFQQRVKSWVYNWLYRLVANLKTIPIFNQQLRKYFKNVKKDVTQLGKEVALLITNYNLAIQGVKLTTPNFIPISAIHVKPPKPLPTDLAKVMDSSKNDIIYFSLGSNVKSSVVNKDQMNKILNVLGKLPYTILWKYETDKLPENFPNNIHVQKWFPQQDVLAHPKVKLFITQGGLQSIDEALSRRVPMLVIPFFGDQKANSDRCARLGIAEVLNFDSFTEEELDGKIRKLLLDPLYKTNIEKQAQIASDEPLSALDKAVFWIEYVIRYKGADHLRYGTVHLPFYQYYFLDVYALVASICLIVVYLTKKLGNLIAYGATALYRLIFIKKQKSKVL